MTLASLPGPTFTGADLSLRVNALAVEARAARRLPTVAALRADATMTYAAGARQVVAGEVVEAGGHRYMVAASLATDHHLTTAGGVRLKVLGRSGVVSIAAFGAVGNDAAADSAAFNAFNAWAVAEVGAVTLHLEPGVTYLVANAAWPLNIRALTVEGHGARIRNAASANTEKKLLLPALGLTSSATGFYAPVTRSLIATAAAGATAISCLTPAEAGTYAVGDWIMVASWDTQFGGQPPNYRFFEYHEVTAVNAGTGVVTLRDKLRFAHQADWPYVSYANGDGRAHIERIEQGSRWNVRHVYNDIEFEANAVSSSGATTEAVYVTGRSMEFNRCKAPYFLVTAAGSAVLRHCTQTGPAEIDKLVEAARFEDCTFENSFESATGCYLAHFERCRFKNGYWMCPRTMRMIDCDVAGPPKIFETYGYMEEFEVRGGNHASFPTGPLTTTQVPTWTLGSSGIAWSTAARTLTLDLSVTATRSMACQLVPGAYLYVTVSSGGSDLCTGVWGRVVSVTGGLNSLVAVIDFTAALAGNERVTFYPQPRRVNINGERHYLGLAQDRYVLRGQRFASAQAIDHYALGRISRIVVDVIRPYTGATAGNVNLGISTRYPTLTTLRWIDLKTAGRREVNLMAHAGWSGLNGESAGAVLTPAWASQTRATAPTMASANDGELPIVDVIVEYEGPLSRGGRF